jgi:hypothetical protein
MIVSKNISTRKGLQALCLLASLMCILACSTSAPPEQIVQEYKEALNSHNVDSLMNYFGDDIVFEIPSMRMKLSGKPALRGLAGYDSVLNTNMVLTNIRVGGDTVICDITETNEWLNAAGMTSAHYPQAIFVVINGKISHVKAEISDSSAANFDKVLSEFVPWVNENHPDAMAEMMPEGNFVFNAKNGETVVRLLRQWRQAMDSEKPNE